MLLLFRALESVENEADAFTYYLFYGGIISESSCFNLDAALSPLAAAASGTLKLSFSYSGLAVTSLLWK